ncbi:MAG TPA: TetR/AcrR family transcriptional regulator [Acidimicrobiales bacterium]|jgi:AcrR family transcriptional regulator|nr:TetR/AcrR family transcriptional regulator [Acidimicrobiales bacterium]
MRERILEAAAHEIELNGMVQFRVKRVAYVAETSVALLYSYFHDREDLIACAVVHRFREVLLGLAETFTRPLETVTTSDDLRQALRIIIAEAQAPARTEARIQRIESMSFARHNPAASAGVAEAKKEAASRIADRVKPLEDKGLLAEGMSAVAFARIWYALFFGQIELEGEHALSVSAGDWILALTVLAESAIRREPSDLSVT